jgi:hypothetical protein
MTYLDSSIKDTRASARIVMHIGELCMNLWNLHQILGIVQIYENDT